MSASEVLPEGTRVRVVARSACGDKDIDPGAGVVGCEYDVCTYAGPGEGDDEMGRPYYLLDDENTYGGSHWAYPEDIEVTMTLEAKRARKAPSLIDLRNAVASEVIGMYAVVEVEETDNEDDASFTAFGRTGDGLHVGFRVTISEVAEVFV
ncbi:MAG: hypothetical protein JWO15_3872 [Sphingomonadales bacterium]|nr:hypothetical protein [Sphingomonadales bacterium]